MKDSTLLILATILVNTIVIGFVLIGFPILLCGILSLCGGGLLGLAFVQLAKEHQ